MKKILLYMVIGMFLISLISASISNLGSFEQETCVELKQTCSDCTFNNITKVAFPNSSVALSEVQMTKFGTYYNHSFCSTITLGEYIVNGIGDIGGTNTVWTYTFDITGDGFTYDQPRAFTYISLLLLLIVFFIGTLVSIKFLPKGNITNELGDLLSINYMKYLTYVLIPFAWFLLIGIFFIASNIGISTGINIFGDLFFNLFNIMFSITPVMLFIWFAWIIVNIFRDRQMKKLLDRGFDFGGERY